jgi:hypothetical protein
MSEGPTHGELILKRLSPTNKTQSRVASIDVVFDLRPIERGVVM